MIPPIAPGVKPLQLGAMAARAHVIRVGNKREKSDVLPLKTQ
jgi:hypothetical protein